MRGRDTILPAALILVVAGAGSAPAQTAGPPGAAEEPTLQFEREVFVYPAGDRRDPFASLTQLDLGPRFNELRLSMIIYSAAGGSVALLLDGGGKMHRVRRGDVVGNARVVNIQPRRVVFEVEDFGLSRQEQLKLPRSTGGGA